MVDFILAFIVVVAIVPLFYLFVIDGKKTRPDGSHVSDVPAYRTMLFTMLPTRQDALILFDSHLDAAPLLSYLEEAKKRFNCDITHCLVAACSIGLIDNPKMDQFVSGNRLYQRRSSSVSFSAKRTRGDPRSKLTAIKYEVNPQHTFASFCEWLDSRLKHQAYSSSTAEDRELGFYASLPTAILRRAMKTIRWLDFHNLLPGFFINHDAFYTSIFIANLGSLKMNAAYHHLYEWGNASLFLMAGKIEDRPVVIDGEVRVRKTLHLRWSYDERVDDGLTAKYGIESVAGILQHPRLYLGCLAEDGSDAVSFGECPSVHSDALHKHRRDT